MITRSTLALFLVCMPTHAEKDFSLKTRIGWWSGLFESNRFTQLRHRTHLFMQYSKFTDYLISQNPTNKETIKKQVVALKAMDGDICASMCAELNPHVKAATLQKVKKCFEEDVAHLAEHKDRWITWGVFTQEEYAATMSHLTHQLEEINTLIQSHS